MRASPPQVATITHRLRSSASTCSESVMNVTTTVTRDAGAQQKGKLRAPEQVAEHTAAATPQLLDLDGDSVRGLGNACIMERKEDARDRQERDVEEDEQGDDDKHVLEADANLPQPPVLEDAPDAIQLADQRSDRQSEGQVKDPWRCRARKLPFSAHGEEAADVEHQAAEHAPRSELRLGQADQLVVSVVPDPAEEGDAHDRPDAREGDDCLAEATVDRYVGTLGMGVWMVHVAANRALLHHEGHVDLSVGFALRGGNLIVAEVARVRNEGDRRSRPSARVSDGGDLSVRPREPIIDAHVDEA
mmetsp:Transcript_1351/g.5801  ORF Transcript_1351/g.5801 Transcript_1351/m.5801 type:complete len:303 (-) Transcript_1351:565-1473(-)